MRFHELSDGIEVLDEENKPIGISKIAAKKVRSVLPIEWTSNSSFQALTEMAMTRAFLPVPILFFPPVVMLAFQKYDTHAPQITSTCRCSLGIYFDDFHVSRCH